MKKFKDGCQFWIGKRRRYGGLDVCQAVPGALAPSLHPWAHTCRLLHALQADNHLPGKTLTQETSKKEWKGVGCTLAVATTAVAFRRIWVLQTMSLHSQKLCWEKARNTFCTIYNCSLFISLVQFVFIHTSHIFVSDMTYYVGVTRRHDPRVFQFQKAHQVVSHLE